MWSCEKACARACILWRTRLGQQKSEIMVKCSSQITRIVCTQSITILWGHLSGISLVRCCQAHQTYIIKNHNRIVYCQHSSAYKCQMIWFFFSCVYILILYYLWIFRAGYRHLFINLRRTRSKSSRRSRSKSANTPIHAARIHYYHCRCHHQNRWAAITTRIQSAVCSVPPTRPTLRASSKHALASSCIGRSKEPSLPRSKERHSNLLVINVVLGLPS